MLHSVFARFKRVGLQWRIMVYVAAGIVVFSAVFALVAMQAIWQSTELVFLERVHLANMISRDLDNDLAHIQAELQDAGARVADSLATDHFAGAQISLHALYEHWIRYHHFDGRTGLVLTDANGRVISIESSTPGLAGRDESPILALPSPLAAKPAAFVDGITSDVMPRDMVALALPLRAKDATLGYLIAELDRPQLADSMRSALQLDNSTYVVELIDRAGSVIESNPKGKQSINSAHLELVAPLWSEGQSGVRTHRLPVGGHVIAFSPLKRISWGVVVEQTVDEALTLPRALQNQFVVFGLLAILAGLTLAFVTTTRVVKPVNALIYASQDIARGNLEHLLDVSGEGEVGKLARSFDEMRVRLRNSQSEIASWNRELEARVQRRTRELAALVESSHALSSTLHLDTLFEILMRETRGVLPSAEGIALFLYDDQALSVRSSYGFDVAAWTKLRFRVGEAIAGKVFETQMPALLKSAREVSAVQGNFSAENREHFLRAIGNRPVQSALGVPLISKGARLGALMAYNFTNEGVFVESDVPVLQAFADQAATAIENARLYAELQQKEAVRAQLLEKVIEAQEEERKRIARELHDEFSQTLTALTLSLQGVIRDLPAGQSDLERMLVEAQTLTQQTLKETNQWILELRPTVLDDLGLVPAIRWYAENRLESAGVRVHLGMTGLKRRLPTSVETTLFRIVQEALSNIGKHARAHQVHIRLEASEGKIVALIEDDGIGFDSAKAFGLRDGLRGIGLLGMRERAALLGGALTIDSQNGRGTRVRVEIPWKEQA